MLATTETLSWETESKKSIRSILSKRKIRLKDFCHYTDQAIDNEVLNDHWRIEHSLLLMKFFAFITKPLGLFGICVEFILNLLALNGGLLGTFTKLVAGSIEIPKAGTGRFLSILGYLERRTDLFYGDSYDCRNACGAGDKFYVDLCAMASNVAYENEIVITNRVNTHWKMHFVKFFDLWNDYLKDNSTHAFMFCDKEVDANIIVLAFRGTETFNGVNWQVDADFSWYKIRGVGKVHLGFMEALGVANRNKIVDFSKHVQEDPSENAEKSLAYPTLVQELQKLFAAHKNAKLLITGHSLGGALSVLFSALLIMEKQNEFMERLMGIYTYGQPRVGDADFGNFMNSHLSRPHPKYFRIVYCNDMVPRLPTDDKLLQFKHFGTCLYYSSIYHEQNLAEAPNRNFSARYFIPIRINAVWETLMCIILPWITGPGYIETRLCTAIRILMGPLIPGVVSHCLVNYINAVRLGPSVLQPWQSSMDIH